MSKATRKLFEYIVNGYRATVENISNRLGFAAPLEVITDLVTWLPEGALQVKAEEDVTLYVIPGSWLPRLHEVGFVRKGSDGRWVAAPGFDY